MIPGLFMIPPPMSPFNFFKKKFLLNFQLPLITQYKINLPNLFWKLFQLSIHSY